MEQVDSIVDKAIKKAASKVKSPKPNWVVYDPVTDKFLGWISNPEAEHYPLPGEAEYVFGWVSDIQKAKCNWIIRPNIFLLRLRGVNVKTAKIIPAKITAGKVEFI